VSTLTLYDYAASANCFKVRLLLAQLGIEHERIPIDIFDGDTLTPEFERLNPLRSTPVLVLPDDEPLIESNAILWYLARGSSYLPDGPADESKVVRWLIYEQSADCASAS
jgi:glutathione S-transferase